MTTIFTKIINKEIPADIIYEDDVVVAFLDIQPVNHGHTLVIPKAPSTDATETEPETLAAIMQVAQQIAKAQKVALGATGHNLIFNCGTDAGQEVFHTHLHVVPRFPNDHAYQHPKKAPYSEGESAATAEKIRHSMI